MKFDKRVISYAFLYVIKNPGLAYKFFLHAFFLITKRDVLVMPPRLGGYQVYLDLNAHMDRNLFYFGKVDEDLAIFIKKYTRTNSVFF